MSQTNNRIDAEIDAILAFYQKASAGPEPFVRERGLLKNPEIFTFHKLQQHLNNPLLSPEWCQIALAGQVLDLSKRQLWKTVQTKRLIFIDKSEVDQAIRNGASVVLEGLDILEKPINRMLQGLEQTMPCGLCNCEAFFSQRKNEAYGGHCDSDDVLVIQIAGEKKWRVHKPQQRRYLNNSPLNEQQMGPLLEEFVIQPGDVMFLRAGVPHRCLTEAAFSLHLSIDLIDRTPNIEQLSHLASERYNSALADPHTPVEEVVARYANQLCDESFKKIVQDYAERTANNARGFRRRIEQASAISAFDQFTK